jgi:inosose dehydratase
MTIASPDHVGVTNRREFLVCFAGVAACVSLVPRCLWSADETRSSAKGKYGGFLMGIQSYTLRKFPLDRALAIIHDDLGLQAVEWYGAHLPVKADDAQIDALKKKTADLDIKMMGHGVNNFTKDHAANRGIFELAKKCGIKNLSADPTPDSFDSLDKLVEEYDIRIAIHNHGPGARYDKIDNVLTAIQGHHKNIGACADLGHYIRSAEDPVKAIRMFEGRLYGIHLKDFAEQNAKAKGVILGKGHLDVAEVFRALKKVNFPADGCLSLEYEENPDNPIDDIKACLAIASEAAQQAVS